MEERVREIKHWLQLSLLGDHVNEQLRKLLLSKLKTICGREWDSSPESISLLEETVGPKALKCAGRAIRERIANGDICNWDLTAVSFVLRSLSNELVRPDEKRQIEAAVTVRNDLAHHPNRIISEREFAEKWDVLQGVLKFFDNPIDLIQKDIKAQSADFASLYSPSFLNHEASALKEEGNKAFRNANYSEALEKYDEALRIVTLKDAERGILFSNRSAAFLKLSKVAKNDDERKSYAKRAESDAKRAAHLQPLWPKCHVRLGDAYEALEKYDKAVGAYDEALALDPNSEIIKTRRDDCRLKLGRRQRSEHLDSMNMHPSSTEEMVKQINQYQRNKIITVQGIKKMTNYMKKNGDELGILDTNEGLKHRDGQGTPVNYELAAKHFSKAAAKKNPQATYELALLTRDGRGVQKNHKLALQLFQKAAEMPPDWPTGIPNAGVREAMHSIGLMYHEGVFVDKDATKAFEWYKRAAVLGYGPSANNLAVMYNEGEGGIPYADPEKAVQYWKLAARDKNTRAMASLAFHYCKQGDVKQARDWMNWAVEGGNVAAIARQEEFEEMCCQREEEMRSVKDFLESELGRTIREDESIQDLHKAYMEQHYPEVAQAQDKLDFINRRADAITYRHGVSTNNIRKYGPEIIAKYAAEGHIYAQQLTKALQHFYTAVSFLIAYEETRDENFSVELIGQLGQCLEIAPFVVSLNIDYINLIKGLVKQKMSGFKNTTCQLDIYARECYAFCIFGSYQENVAFLKKCIAKYPNICYFRSTLACAYGFLKQYTEGLEVTEKALLLFPNDLEILYDKAVMAKLEFDGTKGKPDQEIQNYLRFLQLAPADHRKVPEAYYSIAHLVILKHAMDEDSDPDDVDSKIEQVEIYYKKGLQSEENLLPCFLPYGSTYKDTVRVLLECCRGAAKRKRSLQQLPLQCDTIATPTITLNRSQLTDPGRVATILDHRTMLNKLDTWSGNGRVATTVQPRFEQTAPPSLAGLRAITFSEMNPMNDKVYENCVLDVILIEDPGVNMPSVHVVLEDKKGEVLRGFFYNVKGNPRVHYGAKISIVNPYLRIGANDFKPGIRVDDPKSLFFHNEDGSDRCRYCGEKNSKFQCGKCGRKYCCKECQTQDWKLLKHKLICALQLVEYPNKTTLIVL